jgi:hypothetical protein
MPTHYNYREQTSTISCTQCHATRTFAGRYADASTYASDGTPLADFIRYLPARDRYHAWCRSCERAARNASPRTPRTRRPGSTTTPAGRLTDRRFGVELELGFPRGTTRESIERALTAAGLSGWRVKSDCTIRVSGAPAGWEVVSPPLAGEAGFDALQVACRVLRGMGAQVNRTTGTHVHHEARDMTVEQIKAAARSWFNNQNLIDGLVAASRRGPNSSTYCRPLSNGDITRIEEARDLQSIPHAAGGRYKTLNLAAFGRYGTIEIRQHQGTCDFEKIASWIRFGQAVIDTAKAAPVNTHQTMRGLLETLGDNLDATARTFLLGRTVEFAHAAL